MKKIAAVATMFVAIALLSGCAASGGTTEPDNNGNPSGISSYEVRTADGRTVTCVVWDGYNAGSVSCDWAGAE